MDQTKLHSSELAQQSNLAKGAAFLKRRQVLLGAVGTVGAGLLAVGGLPVSSAQEAAGVASTSGTQPLWLPPQKALLDYDMVGDYRGQISGSGFIDWTFNRSTQAYSLDLEISALFLSFLYASRGTVDPRQGLLPTSYREKRIGRDRTVLIDRSRQQVRFNWDASKVLPMPEGIQDVTSVIMQIAFLLANHRERMRSGEMFPFAMARMGSVKYWEFEVLGQTALETRAGQYQTWRVSRRPPAGGSDNDLKVEFWLAPDMHYLPLQITFNLKGGGYLQVTLKKTRQLTI